MENALIQNDLIEQREGFKVENLEGATWVFRKIRAIQEKQSELAIIAQQEKVRIDKWLEQENKSYENDKEYVEGLLTEYFLSQRRLDNKFKLSTPYGKVTSRKVSKWIYKDEIELIKYLKNSTPELVRVKEELNKAEIKKVFKNGLNEATGEILPHVDIVEEETISIKVEE
ncbi:MAG: host-nuclease inhibitor Gam family protein [Clostridiaceae bacterium]